MCFQRILVRRQRLDEVPQPPEIAVTLLLINSHINVVAGTQSFDQFIHERIFCQQFRHQLRALLKLLQQQATVDSMRTKTAAALGSQVGNNHFRQAIDIRPLHPMQQITSSAFVQVLSDQPSPRTIFEVTQVFRRPHRAIFQRFSCDQFLIEGRWQFRSRIWRIFAMIEPQPAFVSNEVECLLWRLVVSENGLAILNFIQQRSILVAFNPLCDHAINTVKLLRILIMQAVIIVVLARAGDEFLENLLAVLRQCEAFQKCAFSKCGVRQDHNRTNKNKRKSQHT